MFRTFFPDEYLDSTYEIAFEKLYQDGYRGLIFVIDNTLVRYGAMELMKTDRSNTIFVGDQLFTDVYGAKRTGIRNILVKPIHPKEEIQIVFKRKLEKIVLYFYEKEKRKQKNG